LSTTTDRMSQFSFYLASIAALVACACGSSGPECRVGADCASGVCLSDGSCMLASDAGSDGADEQARDGDNGDLGPDETSAADAVGDIGDQGADQSQTCQPNNDWLIERFEMPLQAGLRATFRVALDIAVDTVGQFQAGGDRIWDFSGDFTGDHSLLAELQPVYDKWFGSSYPDADYAARLSDREDLLGVFEITDDSLLLLGVVSPEDGATRTNLSYDPPAIVLSFPLEQGQSFSSESTVSGLASGIYSIYREKYENQVDAHGRLKTPFGEFPVLRVRVLLTRSVGVLVTKIRTFAFVAECFGTVARIDSDENESQEEFTQAAEIWRLSP
jgi:hypothetical protein